MDFQRGVRHLESIPGCVWRPGGELAVGSEHRAALLRDHLHLERDRLRFGAHPGGAAIDPAHVLRGMRDRRRQRRAAFFPHHGAADFADAVFRGHDARDVLYQTVRYGLYAHQEFQPGV